MERVEDTVAEIDDPFVQSGDDDVQVVDRHSREAHQRRRRPSPRQSRESCGRRRQVRSLGRHHVVERDRLQCRCGLCVGLSVRDGEVALERLVDRRRSLCFLQVVEGLLGRATCRDQRPAAQHPCPVGGGVTERSQVVVGEGFEQLRGRDVSPFRDEASAQCEAGAGIRVVHAVVGGPVGQVECENRFEVGVALAPESRLGRRAEERRLPAGLRRAAELPPVVQVVGESVQVGCQAVVDSASGSDAVVQAIAGGSRAELLPGHGDADASTSGCSRRRRRGGRRGRSGHASPAGRRPRPAARI